MRKSPILAVPLLSLALLASSLAAGCGAISFDVSQAIPEQKVPGQAQNPLTGVLPGFLTAPIPINVDLQSETAKRNTGPASHAYLKALSLSATPHASPSGSFDFLSEVHIYVEAQSSNNLPRQEIATLKPVPKGQTTVDFTVVPNIDLLPYIAAHDNDASTKAEITAEATGTQPTMDFTYDGEITITIKI